MEKVLDSMEKSLDKVLETLDLPLGAPIWIFSETTLDSIGLDMAEVEEIMFEFIISLLGTTIQDGGIRKRSAAKDHILYSRLIRSDDEVEMKKWVSIVCTSILSLSKILQNRHNTQPCLKFNKDFTE